MSTAHAMHSHAALFRTAPAAHLAVSSREDSHPKALRPPCACAAKS